MAFAGGSSDRNIEQPRLFKGFLFGRCASMRYRARFSCSNPHALPFPALRRMKCQNLNATALLKPEGIGCCHPGGKGRAGAIWLLSQILKGNGGNLSRRHGFGWPRLIATESTSVGGMMITFTQ